MIKDWKHGESGIVFFILPETRSMYNEGFILKENPSKSDFRSFLQV